ncbi:MAG TPA: hypothetical protein DEA47_04940 [Peptococcaceae bacterium]|nr:MAG: Uncharacterized protein XD50_1086 [Clostridia bacterium 41_269]HBT20688.1 hypothetical protein [Peptococcaceae bacterium]
MLKRLRSILSMPIFSLEEGQQIGKVRGLVVDPETFSVAAIVTDKQSWFGDYKIIPYENVVSIGEHALTIDKKNPSGKTIQHTPNIQTYEKEGSPHGGQSNFRIRHPSGHC